MQADPIKPTSKQTGTKRLKLECEILLSTSAFKLNLRRYIVADHDQQNEAIQKSEEAGADTRSLSSST